jgi:large subunit ribosomal protein L15
VKPVSLSLSVLEKYFEVGETVAPATLLDKKLITRLSSREGVKVLGTGTLSKKLTFKGVSVSGSARSAIEKAGGTIS